MRTLDGAERTLTKEMCVIADASHAVAIAGVMGGAESEISFSTRNLLIESAWFDPISIRRTSKALGLRTEASYRFERGADPDMAELASRRAAELIQQVAGGELLAGVVDVYPGKQQPLVIELSRRELLRVMGADVPDRDIQEILRALGFVLKRTDPEARTPNAAGAAWTCTQPSWRRDVTRGIDLVEEVARHYGYEKFPPRLPPAKQPAHRLPHASAMDRLRERVVGLGYQVEVVAIPIVVDTQRDEIFRPVGAAPAIIGNPLSEDAAVMRSSGVVSTISALEWNIHRGQRNLRLFEIGKRYELRGGEPVETAVLTLGATGLAREKSVHESARELTFVDLKGDLDSIGQLAGGLRWLSVAPGWLAGAAAATISLEGTGTSSPASAATPLGIAGQLAKRVSDQLKLRQDIFVAELQLEPLLSGIEAERATLRFAPIPRFPAVERDFSLTLSDGTSFAQVAETIRALNIPELQSVKPADLFRGGQVSAGNFLPDGSRDVPERGNYFDGRANRGVLFADRRRSLLKRISAPLFEPRNESVLSRVCPIAHAPVTVWRPESTRGKDTARGRRFAPVFYVGTKVPTP